MSTPTIVTEDKGGYSEIKQMETKVDNGFISHDDIDEDEVSLRTETVHCSRRG